ncbi:MAG: 30S ribosomal protein S17 [Gammaproteobacteria bacterium RIFCSPHIGHO2_12_FULL_42_10]|nr:MAG: 30S ribosomal protein S17 [Gammaproteobacteria bacterium RIFCSPHIGHO2_12_FULL_42_10]
MTEQNMSESSARTIKGRVISNKMDKTIIVEVVRKVKHELYGKYIKRFSKMVAHDEKNVCHVGDLVVIQQSRPLSKTKRWMLVEILQKEEVQP